jgi:transcriptional regulator with XRE-family HTH domain
MSKATNEVTMKAFGDLIREAREQQHESVHSLAKKAGIGREMALSPGGAVTMIERATRQVTYPKAVAIMSALEIQDKEEFLKSAFCTRVAHAIRREKESLKQFLSETEGFSNIDPEAVVALSARETRSLFAG